MENPDKKVLFLDIESTDLDADVGHTLCIGYKWAHESKPHVISLLDYPGKKLNDDSALLRAFEPIWEKAGVVVAHYGDIFDTRFLQTRRIINGLKPYPRVSTVDTWKISKFNLKFGSNRLARLQEVLRCPIEKTPLKLSIWSDARAGDPKALKYVIEHCRADVLVLEFVYNKVRSVWEPHPRLALEKGERVCPVCGTETGQARGLRVCVSHSYRRMVCSKCGRNWKGGKV